MDRKYDVITLGEILLRLSTPINGRLAQGDTLMKHLGGAELNIASEIGTMRVTEQIDAMEIMGVNSASYLILPKIVATVLFFPFLAILSILIGIAGGYLISALTGIMIPDDYVQGLLYDFRPYSITYTLIKMAVFAFIITSISAFYGYYAKGNSLEVGAASTKAVVASSIVIMIFNLILTQILLI